MEKTNETSPQTVEKAKKGKVKLEPDKVVGFMGSRGTGKTTLMFFLMHNTPRFVVYDPVAQPVYNKFEGYDESTWGEFAQRLQKIRDDRERSFKLRYIAYEDTDEEFERVAGLLWRLRYPTIFIVEEIASHIHGGNLTPAMYKLVRMGRPQGIGIWFTTQHPKMVPPKLRNNIDYMFVFAIHEPDSKDYMQKWISDQYQPQSLPEYGFYMWQSKGKQRLQPFAPLRLSPRMKKLTSRVGIGTAKVTK